MTLRWQDCYDSVTGNESEKRKAGTLPLFARPQRALREVNSALRIPKSKLS